jgi:chitin disaccharide deacetylase
MMNIIINADDFGHSSVVNQGIIEAFEKGVLTSTTMMVNMPGFEEALEYLRKNPNLAVGLHANMVEGHPITPCPIELLNENGHFYPQDFELRATPESVYTEVRAQIQKLIDSGIQPSHLDSHYHIHLNPTLWQIFFDLALEFKLPLRIRGEEMKSAARTQGIITTDDLIEDFWAEPCAHKLTHKLTKIDRKYPKCIEIMVHPVGYTEIESTYSDYHRDRRLEMTELVRIQTESIWKSHDFLLQNYRQLTL